MLAACYWGVAQAGFVVAHAHVDLPPFWAAGGVALGALVLHGLRLWPGVLLGALAVHLTSGLRPTAALVFAAGAAASAVAGAAALGSLHRFRPSLERLADVVALALVAMGASVLSAGAGALALSLDGVAPGTLQRFWPAWATGELSGILLITPLLLAWSRPAPGGLRGWRTGELAAALALLGVVCYGIYVLGWPRPSLAYPFLIWPALRSGLRGGTLAALLVALIAGWATATGRGPLVAPGDHALTVLNVQMICGATLAVVLVIGAVTSEREAARASDRESGESLRALLEAAPVGIVTMGLDHRITGWNAAAERIFGFTAAEVIGGPVPYLPPDRRDEHIRLRDASLRGEPVLGVETVRLTRDGAPIDVRLSLATSRDVRGRPTGAMAVLEDITQHKRGELALTEQHARIRSILDSALDAVITIDEGGRILGWDGQAAAVFGWSAAEAVGRMLADTIIPEGLREAHNRGLGRFRAGEGGAMLGRRMETSALHRDGHTFPVELAIALAPGSRPARFTAFVRDLTGHKLAEAALEKTEAHLRQSQKMEAVGRLAGGVAHDFNNLLTSILGHTDVVLEELRDADPLRADVLEIRLAAERAARLTTQLLAFSRKQVIQPRVLDLNDAVTGIAGMLRRLIGEEIELVTSFEPRLDPVLADPGQVEQLLVNLVVNARDAMPRGGTLTIETGNLELTREFGVSNPGATPGPHVLLAVHDDGTGMDAATQAMIFEPFFTTKALGQGTGLGLAMVYGIVKQSGGYITVESEPGRGTSMRIYFPRAVQQLCLATPPAKERPSAGSGTILLVEDEDSVRGLTRRLLTRAGYTVLPAADAREALRLARSHEGPIDLLLTDVVMGGLSGPKLAEALREHRPDTAVLFMSGYSQDTISSHGVLDEGIELLRKPFTPASLTARVLQVLRAREGVAAATG